MRLYYLSVLGIVLGFFLIPISKISAATYYVADDTGSDDYTTEQAQSPDTPWKTIQKAATNVAAGDTVNIKGELEYSGENDCGMMQSTVCLSESGTEGNYITFQSWPSTGSAVITAPESGSAISPHSSNSSGIDYNRIQNLIVKNTSRGIIIGGLNNIIANNIVYNETPMTLSVGIYQWVNESSTAYVYNNIVYGHSYAGIHVDRGYMDIKNNIIMGSTGNGISANAGMYVKLDVDYNNLYDNNENYAFGLLQKGGHNTYLDPKFVNLGTYNFHLSEESQLIDAGTAFSQITEDIEGNSRPQGNAYDMGAYESTYTNNNIPNSVAVDDYTPPNNVMTLLAKFHGEMSLSQFGMKNTYSSLFIGDVNEDGFDDVLVGARHTTPNGGFYAFFGERNPSDKEALEADAIIRGDFSGSRVTDNISMGDLDNDGHDELLITDYNKDSNAGAGYIFKASNNFSSTDTSTALAKISGIDRFGTGSTVLGDINKDGFEDYLIKEAENYPLKFYVFYGGSTISNISYADADFEITIPGANEIPFTQAGDINNDGYDDIVFGIPDINSSKGAIYVFWGGPNLTDKDYTEADAIINAVTGVYYLGKWNALADIDNDGFDDLLTISLSSAYVFSGREIAESSSLTTNQAEIVIEATNEDGRPIAIESADINNDGYHDVIFSDSVLPSTYVFYGGENMSSQLETDEADLVFDYIENQRGYFGGPMSTGDVNGDGYTDIATGNGHYDNRTGIVYLFTSPHSDAYLRIDEINEVNSIEVKGVVSFAEHNVGGVEIQVDDGPWLNCTSEDGAFDEQSENFYCYLSDEALGDSPEQVSVRAFNEFGVYIPSSSYLASELPESIYLASTGDNFNSIIMTIAILNSFMALLGVKVFHPDIKKQ